MNFQEYRQFDGIALAKLIKNKEISICELLQITHQYLIENNQYYNFLSLDMLDYACQQATITQSSCSPLAGLPILIKDLLADIKGVPTSCGTAFMQKPQFIPKQDAALIQAYKKAGLIFIAKSTTSELALYPYTESPTFGITRNPWNVHHSAGGSSGGAAAAVASGAISIAHAGDGGGSIRLPAAYCGLFGLKPTRGRSLMAPYNDSWQGLVEQHVLTHSVRDSAAMLDIGSMGKTNFYASLTKHLPRLKIAVSLNSFMGDSPSPAVKQAFDKTILQLQNLGHDIVEATPAVANKATLIRTMLVIVCGTLAAYKRFLYEHEHYKLNANEYSISTNLLAQYGELISAGEAYRARMITREQEDIIETFFEDYDLLLTPSTPDTAPLCGSEQLTMAEQNLLDYLINKFKLAWTLKYNSLLDKKCLQTMHTIGYTALFNMSGHPAMNIPITQYNGLPIGMQFVAAHNNEELLLQLAQEMELAYPWQKAPMPNKNEQFND